LEKEQPIFEGDDLNWLNLDEIEINVAINITDGDNQLPYATPPFYYSTDQQPEDIRNSESELEGHLSPLTGHVGSGGGGLGGDGGNGCAH